MIITRKNALGGRPISKFPIGVDPDSGYYGYKIGYCQRCNNPLYMRSIDVGDIMGYFGERDKPKTPFKHKLIKWLGGSVDNLA